MTTFRALEGLVSWWLAGNLLQQLVQGENVTLPILKSRRKSSRKRKIVLEEKAELEKKKKRLASDISALQLDADSLAKEAEEKAKLVLLSKSNALRKGAKEKETALEKIDDELRELARKSSNL